MRASYQNIYFHSHSLQKKKTDKNKLNSSLHFVMARCDKQDSDSTLSPAKHSSTTEDRHNVSESRTRRQTRRVVLVGYAGRNGRERISFKRKKVFYIIENGESGFKSTENKTKQRLKKTTDTTGHRRINKDCVGEMGIFSE